MNEASAIFCNCSETSLSELGNHGSQLLCSKKIPTFALGGSQYHVFTEIVLVEKNMLKK